MKVLQTEKFKKAYDKLPLNIKTKTKKAIEHLKSDIFYPSLRAKKMGGTDRWEARVDRSYRFTFEKSEDTITLRTVGLHDEGLGKK